MLKIVLFLYTPFFLISAPKVLHLTFHEGSKSEVEEIVKHMGFELDTWNILKLPHGFLDGVSRNSHFYIMTEKRASDIFAKHKETFEKYDLIITSDIAPLSRIFLQNNFKKPLLIWVNNRFDICVSPRHPFPDADYYHLFQGAKERKNIEVIGYTKYEAIHAKNHRDIDSITETIEPTGICTKQNAYVETNTTNRCQKIFFRDYINEKKFRLSRVLSNHGIDHYTGSFAGSSDIARFKAMVHIPCVMSNYFLYENLSSNIVHFIPSKKLFKELYKSRKITFFDWTNRRRRNDNLSCKEILEHCVWYDKKLAPLFIYFDSFEELATLIESTDYKAKKDAIKKWHQTHLYETFSKWEKVFTRLLSFRNL